LRPSDSMSTGALARRAFATRSGSGSGICRLVPEIERRGANATRSLHQRGRSASIAVRVHGESLPSLGREPDHGGRRASLGQRRERWRDRPAGSRRVEAREVSSMPARCWARGCLEGVGDARVEPALCRSRWRSEDESGRKCPKAWLEERVVRVQEAADNVCASAACAVADDRELVPRWRCDHAGDRGGDGWLDASHQVSVAVGKHDDLTGVRPVPLAVGRSHPASTVRHDVEEDQSLRSGAQHAGDEGASLPVERPGLRVLGSQEDRTFQPQLLKRPSEGFSADGPHPSAIRRAHVEILASRSWGLAPRSFS
jgi:hypothetical protein